MTTDVSLDFQRLPKIELHAHLSGSISRQCLHDVWLKKKAAGEVSEDLRDPLLEMPDGKHDYSIKTFFPLFSSYIYHLINDLWSLTQTTLSVLRDFAADGVVYLELRTTPRAMSGSTKADYVRTVLAAIALFESSTPPPSMHTRLLLSVDRRNTADEALEVVKLAFEFQPKGVVGLDLCGNPLVGDVEELAHAFAKTREHTGLGITLHFAEAEKAGGEAEQMKILSWKPDRLGHVIHVGEETKQIIKQRRLGLELCLSCNVQSGMVSGFASHHFGQWWRDGENVVALSTDDVGVFGSPLSNEYALAARYFGLSRQQICELARGVIDVIFAGEEEKERLRNVMWTC